VAACQLGDPPIVAERDFALHQIIVSLADNRRLVRHYSLVAGPIRMFIASSNALLPTQRDVIAQHAPLVAAIGRGDAAAAESGMREHITSEGRALMELSANSGQPSATKNS
jgi:DNA-binding FadR family transcriptional regulator